MLTPHPSLTPTPTPQPHWPHQPPYIYSQPLTPSLSSWDSRISTPPFQGPVFPSPLSPGFHNQFQATYLGEQQTNSPTDRIALAERTQTELNLPQPVQSTTSKRKRTTALDKTRTTRKCTAATLAGPNEATSESTCTDSQSSCTNLGFPIPAVHGVGPSAVQAVKPTLHLAFSRTAGPTSQLNGSLVDHRSGQRTAVASDVWYFVHGLEVSLKPNTLSDEEVLSDIRPDKKKFTYVGAVSAI